MPAGYPNTGCDQALAIGARALVALMRDPDATRQVFFIGLATNGKRAAFLPVAPWEAHFTRPIEDVRCELGIMRASFAN